MKAAPLSRKERLIKVLDIFTLVYCVLLLIILSIGGFSFSLFGIRVSVRSFQNPVITCVLLLIIRKVIKREESFRDFLLFKILTNWIQKTTKMMERYPLGFLGVFVGGYALIMSIVTVLRHLSYHTQAFDLGIFDQLLWNLAHGNGLYSSILGRHFFSEHVSPILFVMTPLYWLYEDPKILLIFQSCALASGAIPVYLLAKKKLEHTSLALLFSGLYVWYLPLRKVNLGDFHPIALTTPFLLFAFLYLDRRKYVHFGIFLTLALLCKEEIALIVFIFGMYLTFIHKHTLAGVILSLGGVLIFAIDTGIIIPHYRETSFGFFHRYSYLGQSFFEIFGTVLFRPFYVAKHVFIREKIIFFLQVFGPAGFLSLLSPSHLLLALPTFSQSILSDFAPQYSINFQYTAPLTPFVFISAIYGLRNLLDKTQGRRLMNFTMTKPRVMQITLGSLILLTCVVFQEKLPFYKLTEHTRLANKLLRLIPQSSSVSAQQFYVPHLSRREAIYLFPDINDAEYVVLDLTAQQKGPISEMGYFEKLFSLLENEGYGVFAYEDNVILLKKGHPSVEFPHLKMEEGRYSLDGALLPSGTGKVEGNVRTAREGRDRKGYLSYGPYFQLPPGRYRLSMSYSTENRPAGEQVGKWDINFPVGETGNIVKQGAILSVEGKIGKIVEDVEISAAFGNAPLEFRSYYDGVGDLSIKNLTIERIE